MTPRSFLLTPELADYVRASSEPPDEVAADLLAETAAHGRARRGAADVPDRARAGRVHAAAHPRARRPARRSRSARSPASPRSASPAGCPTTARCSAWTATRSGRRSPGGTGSGPGWPTGSSCAWATRCRRCARCPRSPTFDLAFVDADKTGYPAYVERAVPADAAERRRAAGQHAARRAGCSTRETDDDRAVVELNAALAADPRWETVLLPLADGLTMLRKR